MKLTYLPDDKLIVCENPDNPILLYLHLHGALTDAEANAFGQLLAAAPQMLAALDYLTSIEADDEGDRTASPEVMEPIWEAILAAGGQAAILLIQSNR